MNVDVNAPDSERKATMQSIIASAASQIDSSPDDNVKLFLLHVAWYEGMRVTKRLQVGGGPGRSFFQFEAPRAKDAMLYAKSKGWLPKLSTACGNSSEELEAAGTALPNSGSWPSGNLIESLLAADNQDLFATLLTRIAFRKVPGSIPPGNQNHAVYWADHWKIVFESPADRAAKIAQFKANADNADAVG